VKLLCLMSFLNVNKFEVLSRNNMTTDRVNILEYLAVIIIVGIGR